MGHSADHTAWYARTTPESEIVNKQLKLLVEIDFALNWVFLTQCLLNQIVFSELHLP